MDIVSQAIFFFAGITRKEKHFLQAASLQVMLGEIGILGENSDNHFDGFSSLCSPKKDIEISRTEKKGSQLPYFNEKVKLAYIRVLCKVRKTQRQNSFVIQRVR
jgi:hypothetical protein